MPGPSREIQLRLFRDSLSTSWGFRLQGGKDLKQLLTVQKVNFGSPVDGELCRGDVILEIQNCDATTMAHQKAQEMIKNSGGSLLLRVRRSVGHPDPYGAPAPTGTGVPPGQPGFMLHRIQDTLSNMRFGPHLYDLTTPGALFNANPFNYGQNNEFYSQPTTPQFSPSVASLRSEPTSKNSQLLDRLYSTLPKPKNTSRLPTGIAEPGWTPKVLATGGRRGQHPSNVTPIRWRNAHPPFTVAPSVAPTLPRSLEPESPAWEGSLRPFMNPHLTDMRIQTDQRDHPSPSSRTEIARFSPKSVPGRPNSSRPPWADELDSAHASNLQYNSPLALYSKTSANEALRGQTSGKSGSQIRSESDVYSLVHEYDRHRSSNSNSEVVDSFTDF